MPSARFMMRVGIATLWMVLGVQAQYGGMEIQEGLSPRFYLGQSPLPGLARRQSGVCASDEHSCLDVNATVCCPNTQYCIIDTTFAPKCCDIGSLCTSENVCDTAHYQCSSTATISGTTTVSAACCPRSCTAVSQFKCASSFGGGCCPFNYACLSNNGCSSSATSTSSAVATEVPSGCTTSQVSCAMSVGGGCCEEGLACTVVSNTNYCASAASSAMRTGPDGILASEAPEVTSPSTHGLSTGAKAGIGAGIAVVALLGVGALAWFCVVHRRRERGRMSQGESSAPALSQVEDIRPGPGGRSGSGYFGPRANAGPFTESPTSPGSSPGAHRGVPISPQGPGDITAPVEIDSRDHSNVTSPGYTSMDEYMKAASANAYAVEMP